MTTCISLSLVDGTCRRFASLLSHPDHNPQRAGHRLFCTEPYRRAPSSLWLQLPRSRRDRDRDLCVLLGLSNVRGLGRKGLRALADASNGDLGQVWQMPPDQVHKVLAAAKVPGAEKIAAEIADAAPSLFEQGQKKVEELSGKGIHVLPLWRLPRQLRDIPDGPRWLFVQGNVGVMHHRPAVAVVGTRKPTPTGTRAAGTVAKMLAPCPILLVSGARRGHRPGGPSGNGPCWLGS